MPSLSTLVLGLGHVQLRQRIEQSVKIAPRALCVVALQESAESGRGQGGKGPAQTWPCYPLQDGNLGVYHGFRFSLCQSARLALHLIHLRLQLGGLDQLGMEDLALLLLDVVANPCTGPLALIFVQELDFVEGLLGNLMLQGIGSDMKRLEAGQQDYEHMCPNCFQKWPNAKVEGTCMLCKWSIAPRQLVRLRRTASSGSWSIRLKASHGRRRHPVATTPRSRWPLTLGTMLIAPIGN